MPFSPRGRRWRRVITTAGFAALTLVAGAGVAAAHVTVDPSTAAAGDSTTLTFRVPTESETASTVGVAVTLPADHPFAEVAVRPLPGWTVTPTKTTLPAPVTEGDITVKEAVTSVTWTADPGSSIGPGEFAEFEISADPVPAVSALEFPTTQTYDDGTVVQWNEPTPASGEEPDHPVPTLTVGGSAGSPTAGSSPAPSSEASVTAAGTSGDSGSTATILAAVGIVIAAAALVVAAVALRRRPTGSNPPREG